MLRLWESSLEIILGGASLANRYGFFAGVQQKGLECATDLASLAGELGFSAVDTAPSYGRSEDAIGQSAWKGEIHTKLARGWDPIESAVESLRRLRRTKLDLLYLFHEPRHWMSRPESDIKRYSRQLSRFSDGFAVSVYEKQELDKFISMNWLDVIQIPLNVMNREALTILGRYNSARPRIFARSILLQGLLARPTASGLPNGLHPYLKSFFRLADEFQESPARLALGWVAAQPNVDGLIMGAQSQEEMITLVNVVQAPPLSREILEAIDALPTPAPAITDPRNWS